MTDKEYKALEDIIHFKEEYKARNKKRGFNRAFRIIATIGMILFFFSYLVMYEKIRIQWLDVNGATIVFGASIGLLLLAFVIMGIGGAE